MIELKEYINESLYGKFLGIKNISKATFRALKHIGKKYLGELKDNIKDLTKKYNNQSIVISATNLDDYNKQCDKFMDMCSNEENRIETHKVYFVKNKDKSFGDFTIYAITDVNYPSIGTDTYYVINFNKEVGFVMVEKFEEKEVEKRLNREFRDLGLRLPRSLDKWVDALEDMEKMWKKFINIAG
jgi:hypothetical protein